MARIREGNLRNLISAAVQETGNKRAGYDKAAKIIENQIKEGQFRSADFSVYSIAEASLREAGYDGLGSVREMDSQRLSEELNGTAFPTLTNTVINSTLVPEYNVYEEQISNLVTEDTSTNTYKEVIGGLQAMEGLEYTPENYPVEETDFGEKKVEVYLGKFERAISITKELVYNDRTGDILNKARQIGKKAGQQLARSIIETIVVKNRTAFRFESASTYYSAVFNGTALTQAEFYSSDHSSLTNVYGGQENANLTTGALSTSALDEARLLFSGMNDERGDPIMVEPRILLVPTALERTAVQLLRSPLQYDTANNAINPFGGPDRLSNYQIMSSRFLDDNSTSEWYLGDPAEQVMLLFWQRLTTEAQGNTSDASFDRDVVARFKASMGFGVGHRDLVYIVKSDASA